MNNLDDIISKVATNSAEIAELKKTFQQVSDYPNAMQLEYSLVLQTKTFVPFSGSLSLTLIHSIFLYSPFFVQYKQYNTYKLHCQPPFANFSKKFYKRKSPAF